MAYGLINTGVASIYRKPSFDSGIVSQVFFAEPLRITETSEKWIKIRSLIDNYEGWIQKHFLTLSDKLPYFSNIPFVTRQELFLPSNKIKIPAFSPLFSYEKQKDGGIKLSVSERWDFLNKEHFLHEDDFQTHFEFFKKTFLGVPYLWGGKSSYGIDCSGLVQLFYFSLKKILPRDSFVQAREGVEITFSELRQGDLAFFEEQGRITHVGIISGVWGKEVKILHASGYVKEDLLTEKGIIDTSKKSYKLTHSLKLLKKIL